MAFIAADLDLALDTIAGGNLRMHFYQTNDDDSVVTGTDYFTRGSRRGIRLGDLMVVKGPDETYLGRISAVSAAGHATLTVDRNLIVEYDSVAALGAAHVPAIVNAVRVMGYYKAGDTGGAMYKRISTPSPAKAHQRQSADGAWWEIVDTELTLEMFGADGSATRDTAAFVDAASVGRPINFREQIYLINPAASAPRINLSSGKVRWTGAGRGRTIVKVNSGTAYPLVFLNGLTSVYIDGIEFDYNRHGDGTGWTGFENYQGLVHLSQCDNIVVQNNSFKNFGGAGLFMNVCTNFRVVNNIVDRGVAASRIHSGLSIGGTSTNGLVLGNKCIKANLGIDGNHIDIIGNEVTGWGFSGGINTQALSTNHSLSIIGNRCYSSSTSADVSPYYMAGIESWASNSVIIGNRCYSNCGNGIDNGGKNVTIQGNVCYNNGTGSLAAAGIYLVKQDSTFLANYCHIAGNVCYDDRISGSKTQHYGIVHQAGSALTGVVIGSNNLHDNKFGDGTIDGTGTIWPDGPLYSSSCAIAASAGTLTTAAATAKWKYVDKKTIRVSVAVTVTNAGTGSGELRVTLPFTAQVSAAFHGYDFATGNVATGVIASSTALLGIRLEGNVFPGTGTNLLVEGNVPIDT